MPIHDNLIELIANTSADTPLNREYLKKLSFVTYEFYDLLFFLKQYEILTPEAFNKIRYAKEGIHLFRFSAFRLLRLINRLLGKDDQSNRTEALISPEEKNRANQLFNVLIVHDWMGGYETLEDNLQDLESLLSYIGELRWHLIETLVAARHSFNFVRLIKLLARCEYVPHIKFLTEEVLTHFKNHPDHISAIYQPLDYIEQYRMGRIRTCIAITFIINFPERAEVLQTYFGLCANKFFKKDSETPSPFEQKLLINAFDISEVTIAISHYNAPVKLPLTESVMLFLIDAPPAFHQLLLQVLEPLPLLHDVIDVQFQMNLPEEKYMYDFAGLFESPLDTKLIMLFQNYKQNYKKLLAETEQVTGMPHVLAQIVVSYAESPNCLFNRSKIYRDSNTWSLAKEEKLEIELNKKIAWCNQLATKNFLSSATSSVAHVSLFNRWLQGVAVQAANKMPQPHIFTYEDDEGNEATCTFH